MLRPDSCEPLERAASPGDVNPAERTRARQGCEDDDARSSPHSKNAKPSGPRPQRTPRQRTIPSWIRRSQSAALAAALLAALPIACAEHQVTSPPPSQSTARSTSIDRAPATASEEVPLPAAQTPPNEPLPSWADAVRLERWSEAAALFDALPESEKTRPAMRYVRARVAIALGDSSRAASQLTGLSELLAILAADIDRWRAEAAADVGPFAEAAAYFARSMKARDLRRAAEALEKGSNPAGARALADKAVVAAQRANHIRDEAAARALRARLQQAEGRPVAALADLRWIATQAAGTPHAKGATEALLTQKQTLTVKERLGAVRQMIESGSAAEALAEIDRITKMPGAPKGELLHARAEALYKARDYPSAVAAFELAAASKTGREAEELYFAGRALARAERDADALKRYREVAARFRSSPWAEKAAFFAARLLMQTGKFKEAATGYASYLAAFPTGESRDDAEYEMALALLSSSSPKNARRSFAKLAQAAKRDAGPKLRELEGVAALRAGDRDGAIRIWTDVAKTNPLTFAAQVSRARLAAAGALVPPLIEPPSSRPALGMAVRLPPTASLLASLGLDADAEAWLASHEREAAAPHEGRESEALCGLYGMLSRAKRRYRVGNAAVGYATLMRAPSEAERWTWECIYPRPYAAHVELLEAEHALPSGFVHALMRQESAFDPSIVSPATAVGLMQLMPGTAKQACSELSLDYDSTRLTNPDYNLRLGAFYSAKLLKTFDKSLVLTAAAYNAGPKAVSHWLAGGADHDVDLFVARIPYEETRNYVAKVMGNLARYQWLRGGDAAVTPIPLELPIHARCAPDAY